ncbi:aromatic amino acid exporter YddG [Neotabrizicola shimadae]|uniref:EamA family transporter n=1 Tax=Neotabrizicola shimadae TaxID=2807096 RepID=A0A8G0ZUM5_9RHOB|nr:EamA family transporter [Neotabrizicola shimadae]QYZ68993.1 EamA family transporter [Neotabrizicola shimadae]
MTRGKATLIGFTAILMWSVLALLTIGSAPVPPFLLNVLTFGLGGSLGLIWTLRNGLSRLSGISWKVYAFGILGLFGYHALYFTAFRVAPSAETGLMAYLWPLFIVLFSGLLPGERLLPQHVIGALVAFAGAALIVLARGGEAGGSVLGLFLGFLCALTWAGYSVLSRRMGEVPTEVVTVFCLGTAALSLPVHLAVEPTVWPVDLRGWLSVLALGLGPVGAAFFTWDIGMKKGDIQVLGVASYAAPVLSTLALVLAGITAPSWTILAAAILIAGGAALAARASARKVTPASGA